MQNEVLFTESQRFKQWWLWFILIFINGLLLTGIYTLVKRATQMENTLMQSTGLVIAFVFTLVITLLFVNARLDTHIKKDGIYVRFFPFHLQFKHYTWDTLTKSFVRAYNPIQEYGGWGFRLGFLGKGKAFNVSGSQGLQIEFTDNKKLLIGTNKPDELREILKSIGRLKE